ncbi:hypothetical protein GF420_07465, partial [candidate division GN15 bacterium]|nr:hypothetical protein [candidate division GN15 bacterium]
REEVDGFREQMAQAFETLKQEQVKLSMENESLKNQLAALKQFEDTIKSAAIDARRNADMTLANAKKEAEEILNQARNQAEEIKQSHSALIEKHDAEKTKLELARKSYISKLRQLIQNHLELVDEIATAETPEVKPEKKSENDLEITESSEMARNTRETVATQPSRQQAIKTEEANASSEIVEVAEADQAGQAPEAQSDDLTESLRQVVKDEQAQAAPATAAPTPPVQEAAPVQEAPPAPAQEPELTREVAYEAPTDQPDQPPQETQPFDETPPGLQPDPAPPAEKSEEERLEELKAAAESPDSPIDPELAAALESYQHAKAQQAAADADQTVTTEAPRQGEVTETTKRAEDVPNGFVAVQESATTDTDKVQTGNAPKAQQPKSSDPNAPIDPDDLARELDSVVEKFNEEMDKAEKGSQ